MSFKSGTLVVIGTVGTYAIGVLAFLAGRYMGQKEVVKKVEDIREQVKHNPCMDLDDALEAQLTDEKGNFISDPEQTDKAVNIAVALGLAAFATGLVQGTGAMNMQFEADKVRYDRLEDEFKDFWDGTANNYCAAYNKSNDVIRTALSVAKELPEESDERETLTSYTDGIHDFQRELDGSIGAFLQSKGAIKERQ